MKIFHDFYEEQLKQQMLYTFRAIKEEVQCLFIMILKDKFSSN